MRAKKGTTHLAMRGSVRRASDEKAFLVEPTKCAVGGNADWSKRCCVEMCIMSIRRLARVLPNLVCWQMVLDPEEVVSIGIVCDGLVIRTRESFLPFPAMVFRMSVG